MPATIKINVNTTFNAYLYNTVPLHSTLAHSTTIYFSAIALLFFFLR